MNLVWTFSFLIFLLSIFYSCGQGYNLSCDPVQYLQLATLNIINCSMSKPFNGVYWFDTRETYAVVSLIDNVTSCPTLTSGELDIHCNGSLIINNVSFVHEHEFKVVVLYPNAISLEANVRVIVFVKPLYHFPIIDQCGVLESCVRNVLHIKELICRVEDARPVVNLTWIMRNPEGDHRITTKRFFEHEHNLTSSFANITINPGEVDTLALFVCSSESTPSLLRNKESQIIVEYEDVNITSLQLKELVFKLHTNQTLSCGDGRMDMYVWKKQTSQNQFKTILFSIGGSHTPLVKGYRAQPNGVLILEDVSVEYEGVYVCLFGDGLTGGIDGYNVSLFEPEQPGTDVTTDGTQLPQEQKEETSKLVLESTWMIFGIAGSAVAVLLITCILLCSCIHSKHRRARNVNEHDDISARSYPMQRLEPGEYEEGTEDVNMKLTFIRELKEFYKTFCKEQLCFSVRNNLKFFPDVFVENCLQLVGSTSPERGVYHKMFADAALKRVILVGNPGIGKTTITLKAAYDWCSEDSSSPLKNIDIFILLRLGDISQENSLSSAIKTRLLPKDSQIKEDCIKRFIRAGMSIVIVFDGLEEYCGDGKSTSEISKIIESFMLPNIKVVITTTPLCLPKGIGGEGGTTQIYVRGFNESKCLQYMRRAVGNGGQIFYQNIEKALNESLYLKYFCSVPLLSMMISHMAHYSADLTKITSVTTLFNLYFKRNEDMDAHASETFYSDLYEKAFNTLTSTDKEFTLCSEDFVQPIAEDFYRKFVGVLIKSTGTSNSVSEGGATANTQGKVYFSHQLFQQWFAAHHLVKILKNTPEDLVNQSLTKIEPCRVPYLLRFACGLSKTATKQIIQYIGNDERNQSLVILCICEKDRCFSLMESAMKQLLLKPVRFYKDNMHTDTYLQKATIEFLESASQKEIIISKLEFHSCLQSFTKTSDNLTVSSSGLTIPTLKTLQCLEVHEPNRQIKINEVAAIINISSSYKMLTKLSFISTKQPHNFSDKEFVASLGGIHFKVYWTTRDQDHYFVLNNQSGIWEIPGPVLSPIDGEQFTYPTK